MTKSRNYLLCYENFATNCTVFTFGKTCVFTIRSNCLVNNFHMAGCRNGCSYAADFFATYYAVGYCVVGTVGFTVGCYCIFNHCFSSGMADCRNGFGCLMTCVVLTFIVDCSVFVAGCVVTAGFYICVTCCTYIFCFVSIATITSEGGVTFCFTGGSSYYCSVGMCQHGYYDCFSANFCVTYRTKCYVVV